MSTIYQRAKVQAQEAAITQELLEQDVRALPSRNHIPPNATYVPGIFDVALALQCFEQRKKLGADTPKIDNSSLCAGSPMYYYCKHCGMFTEELPETHLAAPKVVCDPCRELQRYGLL